METKDKQFHYFHANVLFTGKHARYIDALWEQNKIHNSYFNRLYELYLVATVIGLRANRKAKADTSDDDKRQIPTEQILHCSALKELMKLVLLIDEDDHLTKQQKVDRAFRGPKDETEFKANVDLFNSYARGGIEVLYEELVLRELDINDAYTDKKVGNLMALLENKFVPEM